MRDYARERRLMDRARRIGLVVNTGPNGYQVALRDDPKDVPEAVFGRDFELDLDDVEAVIEGADAPRLRLV